MKLKHDNVVKIEALLKQLLDITGRWDFDSGTKIAKNPVQGGWRNAQ
jgi:hypothetical protein